ncbi:MAG: diacylglycerol kinase family protein, partial [Hyphomicrobiales bacterium]
MAHVPKTKPTVLVIHKKSCMRPEVKEPVKAVQGAGHKLHVIIPWNGKELKRALSREIANGATRLIAGGGDGTLNKVTRRLMKHEWNENVSLGVLPLGTANDFARGAGLPLDNLEAALTQACTGDATPIDVG